MIGISTSALARFSIRRSASLSLTSSLSSVRSFHASVVDLAKLNVEGLAEKVDLEGQNVLMRGEKSINTERRNRLLTHFIVNSNYRLFLIEFSNTSLLMFYTQYIVDLNVPLSKEVRGSIYFMFVKNVLTMPSRCCNMLRRFSFCMSSYF